MANEPCSFSRFRTCSCNWSNQRPSQKLTRLNLCMKPVLVCSISIVCTGRGQRYPHLSLILHRYHDYHLRFSAIKGLIQGPWLTNFEAAPTRCLEPSQRAMNHITRTIPAQWSKHTNQYKIKADRNWLSHTRSTKPVEKNQLLTLVTERLWQFVARICSNNVQNLSRGWKTCSNPVSNSLSFCWIRSQMTKHQLLHIIVFFENQRLENSNYTFFRTG